MKKLCAALLIAIGLSQPCSAVTEIELKAIFLEKFTHLITWPQDQQKDFSICVLNDKPFAMTLRQVYFNKTSNQKPVKILDITEYMDAPACHLIFLGKETNDPAAYLQHHVHQPVLTVSDEKTFPDNSVMIIFYLKDHRFHYTINQKLATQADIKISYLLLRSAEKVIQ